MTQILKEYDFDQLCQRFEEVHKTIIIFVRDPLIKNKGLAKK